MNTENKNNNYLLDKLLWNLDFSNALLNAIDAHIIVLNKDLEIITFNHAWEDFIFTHFENNFQKFAVGAYLFDFIELIGYERYIEKIKNGLDLIANRKQKIWKIEIPFYKKNKVLDWFSLKLTRMGKDFYVLSQEKITELKEIKISLNNQNNFLKSLMDTIPHPVFYKKIDGSYLGCNKKFELTFNLKEQEIINKTDCELNRNDLIDKYFEPNTEVIKAIQFFSYESSILYSDNKIHDVIIYKSIFRYDGDKEGILAIILDITEQKEIHQKKSEYESIYKGFLNAANESIIVIDSKHNILSTNQKANDCCNLDNSKIGKPIHSISSLKEYKYFLKNIFSAFKTKQNIHFEDYNPSGKWTKNSFYPTFNQYNEMNRLIIFFRDITLEKQITNNKAELENKINQLTGNMYNSIKNKMDSIYFFLTQSKNLLKSNNQGALYGIELAERLAKHISNTSKNFLFITQCNSFNFTELVKELKLRTELRFQTSTISYSFDVVNAPLKIILGPEIIQFYLEVYTELMNNIIYHSSAKNAFFKFSFMSPFLELSIKDDGIGFNYSEVRKNEKSFGLELIEQFCLSVEASFKINSKPENGTTITIQTKV